LIIGIQLSCSSQNQNVSWREGSTLHPLNADLPSNDFFFLDDSTALNEKNVVLLGESIHMSHEQPLARVGLVRHLNQKKRFDLIAFEGSMIDFWIALDRFLNSNRTRVDEVNFRKMAFFGLWQTKEMDQVTHSILSTFSSRNPLYLTSFDIQPGIGFGFHHQDVFSGLMTVLKRYGAERSDAEIAFISKSLRPLQFCAESGFPKNEQQDQDALKAVSQLDKTISTVIRTVKAKYPQLPHAETLSLIPSSLRKTIELCRAHHKNTDLQNRWSVYQPKRDELNAKMAKELIDQVSKNHRLIAWAHHSHVNYNSLKRVRLTLGEELKRLYPQQVFALGVFSGDGSALIGQDEPELKKIRPVSDSEMDEYLNRMSSGDFYLEPRDSKDPIFFEPKTIRIEGVGLWKIQLGNDYDAIIKLQKTSPPEVDFSPPASSVNPL